MHIAAIGIASHKPAKIIDSGDGRNCRARHIHGGEAPLLPRTAMAIPNNRVYTRYVPTITPKLLIALGSVVVAPGTLSWVNVPWLFT
jgi:hypothetical protein